MKTAPGMFRAALPRISRAPSHLPLGRGCPTRLLPRTNCTANGVRACALALVAVLLGAIVVSAAADSGCSVVRVEAAVSPLSAGPGLAADLAARQPWTPYQSELARRLRIGGSGSGFFVSAQGDVVTNAHVVLSGVRYRGLHLTQAEWNSMRALLDAIRDVWVTVGRGESERSYLAVPIALDENLDLAVLRIARPPGDSDPFPALPIGDSDRLALGDPIRALGYADGGFQDTTGSLLSLIRGRGVHERMSIVRRVDPATGEESIRVSGTSPGPVMRLHHDAPVGHGNSGGPILDARGRVVGVAYALISERGAPSTQGTEPSGLNLAIASNVLKRFLTGAGVSFTEANR